MEMTDREIDVKVVSIDKIRQSITIDVLQPLFENWINSIVADKTIQYNVKAPKVVSVSDLKLSNGGFIGKALVPAVSDFIGEPYYVDAFIPGSQIVLNIESDFSRWNGATVDTFVAGYTTRPGSVNQMSLICSRKSLLNFAGNLTKIELYGDYCTNGKKWKSFTKSTFTGNITGVINSAKKCGVFVELPIFNITGMINVEPERLVEFKAGEEIAVRITDFEKMVEYDPTTGNLVHQEPYKVVDGCLKSCILKPVFELA
jgi:ribosomal protein S1